MGVHYAKAGTAGTGPGQTPPVVGAPVVVGPAGPAAAAPPVGPGQWLDSAANPVPPPPPLDPQAGPAVAIPGPPVGPLQPAVGTVEGAAPAVPPARTDGTGPASVSSGGGPGGSASGSEGAQNLLPCWRTGTPSVASDAASNAARRSLLDSLQTVDTHVRRYRDLVGQAKDRVNGVVDVQQLWAFVDTDVVAAVAASRKLTESLESVISTRSRVPGVFKNQQSAFTVCLGVCAPCLPHPARVAALCFVRPEVLLFFVDNMLTTC